MRKFKEKIKEKIDSALSSMEEKFSLKAFEIVTKNKTNLIKVFVDRPGGITIDDCVHISEKLSVHPELFDLLPGAYRLEVSSPGAENKEER
jgi:ribosome maturation factor RimP